MEQLTFFTEAGQSKGIPNDMLHYQPGLFTPAESAVLMAKLLATTPWQQQVARLYDKEVITPRLMAWYGDASPERLPGILPWTDDLLLIRERVEPLTGFKCNAVLLNYYRNGQDSVAWHSDKGSTVGKTVVGSVSFGQVRGFDIRNKFDHAERYTIRLENGSFLLMKAGFQDAWEHRIAKSAKVMRPRLNLTFRLIG